MGQDTMANRERGGNDGEKVRWSYREIFKTGSPELREIIEIITGRCPPGIPLQKEEE